jgi:hypothetical protein
MIDKTGKSYELLAQVVFQAILNQRDLRNITVERNVILKGKHGNSHEIDIYWKFALNHLEYETIVQAKDWKEPVSQGELLKFKSVLDDIPGQPKGIFISRTGYQKGARDFALAHGILIYELREAEVPHSLQLPNTGWATLKVLRMPLKGVIGTVGDDNIRDLYSMCFLWDVYWPEYTNIRFQPSLSWLQDQYPALDASRIYKTVIPPWPLNEQNIYDEQGEIVTDLLVLFRELAETLVKEGAEQKRMTQVFEKPSFLRTTSSQFPLVKVDSVSLDVKVEHRSELRRGRMLNFPQWVLHQVNSGHVDWFAVTPSAAAFLPTKSDC